jgi:hypothetical protein
MQRLRHIGPFTGDVREREERRNEAPNVENCSVAPPLPHLKSIGPVDLY